MGSYNLQGPDSEEFNDAAKLEDDVNFYQTNSPDVAKIFHFDSQVKRPAVVLLKNEAEKLSLFGTTFLILNTWLPKLDNYWLRL